MTIRELARKIALWATLTTAGAGIATPIAFSIGRCQGRESTKPIKIETNRSTDSNYRFLEWALVTDKSGRKTVMWQYDSDKSERINRWSNARLVTRSYRRGPYQE